MKTLRISDDIHSRLTAALGTVMAQIRKMQTYEDTIRAMLNESVMLPRSIQFGFTTKEESIRDAIRFRLTWLKRENECVEIPKEQYDRLGDAVKQMSTPYQSAEDFITRQIDEALEKYEEWKRSHKKR